MAQIEPLRIRDFSGGMTTNLNENIRPENTVALAVNMDFDYEIGSATSRNGTDIVGTQTVDGNTILGLHQHIDHTNSANNKLFATVNASGGATSVIYDVNDVAGGAVVTGLTASKKMRFLTFLGETLAINGSNAERSWNGSSWITTGGAFDLADFPGSNSCELVIEFLDRVYAAGDDTNPDRLHFSSTPTSGAISWDGDFVDIEPEDGGGKITALAKVPGYLLIFKERSLHRFDFYSTYPESLISIGTPSQESVVSKAGLCAFYSNSNENARGFYITNGSQPVPISHDSTRPIKKFVDAISSAQEANIAGWATERDFAWSVGDLVVDGVTYTNAVLRYNHQLNQWSVRTYPTQFSVFANYLVSGVNTIVGGDDDGQVIRLDKPDTYTDYNAKKIHYILRTSEKDFGFLQKKILSDSVVVRTLNAEGGEVAFYTDLTSPSSTYNPPFESGGKKAFARIENAITELSIGKDVEANDIAVEISGEVNGARVFVREIELPVIEVTRNYA